MSQHFDNYRHPKRRRDKRNPYVLFVDGSSYYVSFIDNTGKKIRLKISKELYDVFDQFELDDLSYLNKVNRHYEHSHLTESTLHRRLMSYSDTIEDQVELHLQIHEAINHLTETQKHRIQLYYFYGYTYEEIAKTEGCSMQSVAKSIATAIKKLKKFLTEG